MKLCGLATLGVLPYSQKQPRSIRTGRKRWCPVDMDKSLREVREKVGLFGCYRRDLQHGGEPATACGQRQSNLIDSYGAVQPREENGLLETIL